MPKTAIPGSKNESVKGTHVNMLNFMFTAWCKKTKTNFIYIIFPFVTNIWAFFLNITPFIHPFSLARRGDGGGGSLSHLS